MKNGIRAKLKAIWRWPWPWKLAVVLAGFSLMLMVFSLGLSIISVVELGYIVSEYLFSYISVLSLPVNPLLERLGVKIYICGGEGLAFVCLPSFSGFFISLIIYLVGLYLLGLAWKRFVLNR
ncbi:MAG: hypothetical protein AB4426_16785 [Xenococcaceae cyanobacterium]